MLFTQGLLQSRTYRAALSHAALRQCGQGLTLKENDYASSINKFATVKDSTKSHHLQIAPSSSCHPVSDPRPHLIHTPNGNRDSISMFGRFAELMHGRVHQTDRQTVGQTNHAIVRRNMKNMT